MLPPPVHPRASVLIVDDDAGVRGVCTALLHSLGFRAREAKNGQQALETLARSEPDVALVLLDLEMPGMPGEQVLRALKRARPGLPVLLMSGRPRADLETFLESGADGVLPKPFGLSDLDTSVCLALASS